MSKIVPAGHYEPWHLRVRKDALRIIARRQALRLITRLGRYAPMRRIASLLPWSRLARFPVVVCVELTNRCDLGCVMCHRNFMERSEGDMDMAMFRAIAREMGAVRGTMLVLIGQGEPTLHPHFLDCIRLAKSEGIERVLLQTNGGGLVDMAEELVAIGLDELHVSMDGADEKTFAMIRKGANVQRIEDGVRVMLAARDRAGAIKPSISLRYCTLPVNAGERDQFWRKWKDVLGVNDEVRFDALQVYKEAPITDEAAERPCSILWKRVFVRWNGDYAFCCNHKDNRLGIRERFPEMTLTQMWENRQLERARRLHLLGRKREIAACAICPLMRPGMVFDEVS